MLPEEWQCAGTAWGSPAPALRLSPNQSRPGEMLLLNPACAVRGQARRHLRQGSFLLGTPCSFCCCQAFLVSFSLLPNLLPPTTLWKLHLWIRQQFLVAKCNRQLSDGQNALVPPPQPSFLGQPGRAGGGEADRDSARPRVRERTHITTASV